MVTAELATALPVLVVLMATGAAAAGVLQSRVRCADAAREAARAVARGEPARAVELAGRAAGRPVSVVAGAGPDSTTVTVHMPVRPVPWLGTFTVSESAVVATEPGAAP